MKKFAVVLLVCFVISTGSVFAEQKKIPKTIASPALVGPHYIWNFGGPVKAEKNKTALKNLVEDKAITSAAEKKIKNNQK